MTKQNILNKVLNFGIKEEKELLTQNKPLARIDAYQFSYQREILVKLLFKYSKKQFLQKLYEMVNYTIDNEGFWHYNSYFFVHKKEVRCLLETLMKDIIKK